MAALQSGWTAWLHPSQFGVTADPGAAIVGELPLQYCVSQPYRRCGPSWPLCKLSCVGLVQLDPPRKARSQVVLPLAQAWPGSRPAAPDVAQVVVAGLLRLLELAGVGVDGAAD